MSLSDRFAFVSATISRRPLALATVLVVTITLIALFATGTVRFPSRQTAMDFALRQRVSATSTLQFSFPALMDHQSVEEQMTIPDGINGKFSWNDETLMFQPSAPLPAGKTVVFHLDRAAKQSDGSPLGEDLTFTFIVAGPPLVTARIPDVGAQSVAETSRVTIIFDRPMIPLTQVQGDASQARLAGGRGIHSGNRTGAGYPLHRLRPQRDQNCFGRFHGRGLLLDIRNAPSAGRVR